MRNLLAVLGLSLLLPAWAVEDPPAAKAKPAGEESSKAAGKGKSSRGTRTEAAEAPPPEKPAVAQPDPERARQARRVRDLEGRLKRLEQENLRLRKEVAEKVEAGPVPPGSESSSPEGALAELKSGNARFMAGARTRTAQPANDPSLRQALAKGQAPFAVVVTCSDSRLGESFIFDQELGRIFTVREAGNAPDLQSLASIEYAAEHLGSKLVVVLGHGSCGAVKAVLESGPKPLPGNLWSLQAAMPGLLQSVKHDPNESSAEHLGHLVEANAVRQAQAVVERSEIVRHLCSTGKLKVVPAVYDLATGKVDWLALPAEAAPKEAARH